MYERLVQAAPRFLGADSTETANLQNTLAAAYYELGQYARGEVLCRRSLAIRQTRLGSDHPLVAQSLNNLAALYLNTGQYAKAEPAYQRSLAIYESRLGRDHPLVAESLHNLAELYRFMGRYEKAAPLYQRSLAIRQARLEPGHPHIGLSLQGLALLYQKMGRYAEAEPLCKRSLAIFESRLGQDHPLVATCLDYLATLYREMGQDDKAEPLYRRSLSIRQKKLGQDHHSFAASLNNLAALYKSSGQFGKAEPLYQRSLELALARLGPDHPDVSTTLINLASLYGALGQTEKTAELFDRSRRGLRRHITRILPVLSEADQAAFLASSEENPFHLALSLGLQQRGSSNVRVRSAGWLLNGKATALQALAETTLLGRDSQQPELAELSRQLLDIRQRLAQLTLAPPQGSQATQLQRQRDELSAREQELARQLRRAGGRAARDADWVELDSLRQRLSASAAFIDLARFRVLDFNNQKAWQPPRYAAWITRKQGEIQVVDLGPADKIDQAIQKARQALADAPATLRQQGEADAEKALQVLLGRVAELVLKPLLPHIGKCDSWIVSPDSQLWLLPWGTLPLPSGKYAIEEHTISYVVSGRDLVREPFGAGIKPTTPLILADPDFDQVAMEMRQALGQQPLTQTRSLAALKLGNIVRLPGTAAEAEAILPRLKGYTGMEPRLFTEGRASVSVFLTARNPSVVVLSTHGFVLPDQQPGGDGAASPRTPHNWENPLLRCGLLLAGCNKARDARVGGDNGVLTGLQIVGCDLRGCELVVLSACETGLGVVRNGEGVAGLRQAFQLAGAQNVVATLWQVPDQQSAQLMIGFFDKLAQKLDRADALRQAQLERIALRRERQGAAHPFFWAAFTLTGR